VKHPFPRSSRTDPRVREAPTQRKLRQRAGNARGAGARSIVRVAEVDRTHRASCPPGDRKVSWHDRALARRMFEAPLTRSTGRETAKRCARQARFFTVARLPWPAGFGLRVHDTTEGVFGFLPAWPLPAVRSRALGSQVKRRWHAPLTGPQGFAEECVTASASDGTEAGSGVPGSDNEDIRDRRGSVKARRGPTKSKAGPHPRR